MRRFSTEASDIRRRGHFARLTTIEHVYNDQWVAAVLQTGDLGLGDYALIAEFAPQQWQRDSAVQHLR